jgi:ribonuclease HI
MPKPTAPALKKQILDLLAILPDTVSLPRVLTTLANHDAVLRMLAQAHPGADPTELKQALARTAALLRALEQWTGPASPAEKVSSADKTPQPPVQSVSDEKTPASGDLSDPTVLAQHSRVKVHVDGASKGNPGPASAGIVITDVDGTPLYEEACYLGHMTNNAAEYGGLLRALEILTENGRPETYVFADSLLMVNQMNHTWAVKHEGMKPLFTQAQKLKRLLPRFQIVHVTRDKNTRADALANLAIKQARDAGKL